MGLEEKEREAPRFRVIKEIELWECGSGDQRERGVDKSVAANELGFQSFALIITDCSNSVLDSIWKSAIFPRVTHTQKKDKKTHELTISLRQTQKME